MKPLALLSAFIIAALLFVMGCAPKEDFAQTTRRVEELSQEERIHVIGLLYAEAAQYDKSFWNGVKGDVIRIVAAQVQAIESDVWVIYDEKGQIRIVKAGRRKIFITQPSATAQ